MPMDASTRLSLEIVLNIIQANLNNPNTSEESKAHSRQILGEDD